MTYYSLGMNTFQNNGIYCIDAILEDYNTRNT